MVLTVIDAARASVGLTGAPGSLRVVDEKTVYFRPPASYLEPETLLMVLKNLMRQAYNHEQKNPPPAVIEEKARPKPAKPEKSVTSELAQLSSLRTAGVLTDDEFEKARKRLLAKA